MKRGQQVIILLGLVVAVHLGVLTYASVTCVNKVIISRLEPLPSCSQLSKSWGNATETYVAVFLALLVPTRKGE